MSILGGVIVTSDFLDTHSLNGKTGLIGTVTALYDIGCFFGAILAVAIGEKLGRKNCILMGTSIMTIGAVIQIASYRYLSNLEIYLQRMLTRRQRSADDRWSYCRRNWQRNEYVDSPCMASRNLESGMERQAGRY